MRWMYRLVLCFGLLAPAGVAAQGGAFADRFRIETVAEGVHAVIRTRPQEEVANSNTLVIVNAHDVVVVDTNIDPATARAVVAAIRRLTPLPVRYVVNTHWHDDHIIGNSVYRDAWPGVEFIAHAGTRTDVLEGVMPDLERNRVEYPRVIAGMEEQLRGGKRSDGSPLTERDRQNLQSTLLMYKDFTAQMPAMTIVAPTLTVDSLLVLHRGEREIRILHLGLGNTRGDLVVHLPRERVLATGDLVVRPIPFAYGSFIGEWVATLERLRQLDAAIMMPGHGEVMRDDAYIRDLQELLTELLRQMRAAVARGLDLEQARAAIDLSGIRRRFTGDDPRANAGFHNVFFLPATERAFLEASGETRPPR